MLKTYIRLRALLTAYLTLGIASWVGAGVGLANMLGGSDTPTQTSSSISPWTIGNANAALQQGMGYGQAALPFWQSAFQNQSTIDPSQLFAAGNQAGGQYGNLAQLAQQYQQFLQNQANQTAGASQNLYGAGNQAWLTSMDPQNALYNRTLQRIQDQSRAASSARGLGMSAEGAGLENQAVGNFNIDWQNQQLGRMLSGLQGMTSAYGGAGQQGQLTGANLSGAMNFGAQAPGYTLQSAQTPISAYQQGYDLPAQAADQYYGRTYGAFAQPYFTAAGLNGGGQSTTYNPYQSQANNMNAFLTGLGGITGGSRDPYNQPGTWLNNVFNSGNTYGYGGGGQIPTSVDWSIP